MGQNNPAQVLKSSGATTVTGDSGSRRLNPRAEKLSVVVDVTAQSGTAPTLDVTVQWSHDGGTTWVSTSSDAFTQYAATTGTKMLLLDAKAPVYRVLWAIAGTTPSFTFSVTSWVN